MASSCYTMKNAKNVESKMHCRGVELEDGRSIGEIMEEHGIDVSVPVVIRVVKVRTVLCSQGQEN